MPTSRGSSNYKITSLNKTLNDVQEKKGKNYKSLHVGVSDKDLLSYYNTSKHIFEGNSPFIEMNFATNHHQ